MSAKLKRREVININDAFSAITYVRDVHLITLQHFQLR